MLCCFSGLDGRREKERSPKTCASAQETEGKCAPVLESSEIPDAQTPDAQPTTASTQPALKPAASEHVELSCRLFSGELPRQSSFLFKDEQGKQLQEHQLLLARAQLLCDVAPTLKTMFTQDGHVLAQNSSSKSYYGDLTGRTMWSTNRHGSSAAAAHAYGKLHGALAELFAMEDDEKQLPSFLEHMENSQSWRSMIRVPPCLALVLQQRGLPKVPCNDKPPHKAEAPVQAPGAGSEAQADRSSFEFGSRLKSETPLPKTSMWPATRMQPSSRLQAQLTNKATHSSSHSFAERSHGSKSQGQLLQGKERVEGASGQALKQVKDSSHLASGTHRSFAERSHSSKSQGQLLQGKERVEGASGQALKQVGDSFHLASGAQQQEQQQHQHLQQQEEQQQQQQPDEQPVGPQRRVSRVPSRVTLSGLASSCGSSSSSVDEAIQQQEQQSENGGGTQAPPPSPPLVLLQQQQQQQQQQKQNPLFQAHEPTADIVGRQASASQLLSLALSAVGSRKRPGVSGRRRLSSSDGVMRHTAAYEQLLMIGSGSHAGVGGRATEQQDNPSTKVRAHHHEVELVHVFDPLTSQKVTLLVQSDVTEQVEREDLLSQLVEGQLALLSQIYPRHIIDALSNDGEITASNISETSYNHSNCTILFLDLVGFTAMSKSIPAEDVLIFLNLLFSRFDKLVNKYQVQKIDVIGDAYLVGSGILSPDDDGYLAVDKRHNAAHGAGKMVALAIEMHRAALGIKMPDGKPVQVRIGLHTGPCVSGLLGCFNPKFSIFGDSVNTAARMEQTTEPQSIHLSNDTYSLLPKNIGLDLVPTGGVECKGKGMMETWVWRFPDSWKQHTADKSGDSLSLPQACVELFKQCGNSNTHSQQLSDIFPTSPLHLLPKVLQATTMLGGPAASEEGAQDRISPALSKLSTESRYSRQSHRKWSPSILTQVAPLYNKLSEESHRRWSPTPPSTTQESRTDPLSAACESTCGVEGRRSGMHSTQGRQLGKAGSSTGERALHRSTSQRSLRSSDGGQLGKAGSSTGERALHRSTSQCSKRSSDGGQLGKAGGSTALPKRGIRRVPSQCSQRSSEGGELGKSSEVGKSSTANAIYLPSFHGGMPSQPSQQGHSATSLSPSPSQHSFGGRSQAASSIEEFIPVHASNRGLHSMSNLQGPGKGWPSTLGTIGSFAKGRSAFFLTPTFEALTAASSSVKRGGINSASVNVNIARRALVQENASLLEAEIRPWSAACSFKPSSVAMPEDEPQSLQ